ncbi:hypothetical protein B566_EDAN016776, partial [Ephemera danica]
MKTFSCFSQSFRENNSELAKQNTNHNQADQVTRDENLAFNIKIKELKENLTHQTKEIFDLQQNISNLVLFNRNIGKSAEDLQKELTSMNFSLSNLKEYCKK